MQVDRHASLSKLVKHDVHVIPAAFCRAQDLRTLQDGLPLQHQWHRDQELVPPIGRRDQELTTGPGRTGHPHGLAQNRLARPIGISPNRIAEIVGNRWRITADAALRLSLCCGNSPEFWLNLQTHYDLKIARRQLSPDAAERIRSNRAA